MFGNQNQVQATTTFAVTKAMQEVTDRPLAAVVAADAAFCATNEARVALANSVDADDAVRAAARAVYEAAVRAENAAYSAAEAAIAAYARADVAYADARFVALAVRNAAYAVADALPARQVGVRMIVWDADGVFGRCVDSAQEVTVRPRAAAYAAADAAYSEARAVMLAARTASYAAADAAATAVQS